MLARIKTAVLMLLTMTVLTGLAYPLVFTGVAQVCFPRQANGSLIVRDGKPLGSTLIGQPFDDPRYFWGRASATGPTPYNGAASSGSNLATGNPTQLEAIAARAARLRKSDPLNKSPIPIDLVTASGSGLDPHISIDAARWQLARVARARGLDEKCVAGLVESATSGRQWKLFGEPRVNVMRLNLSLDTLNGQGDAK